MKQNKLMKALTIRHKIQQLKKRKPSSRFVEWEMRVDWKLKQQELTQPKFRGLKYAALSAVALAMPYPMRRTI